MQNNPLAPAKSPWRGLSIALFGFVFVASCAGIYYFIYYRGAILFDALSRTANAYYVLYLEPKKLSSLGFVWNPLPSLLQLPILLFKDLWPALATHGISGGIVTALCTSFNAVYLFRYFKEQEQSTGTALAIIALYTFNPYMFYYGVNGLSEMPMYSTIIVGVIHMIKWMEKRRSVDLVIIALTLVLGFMCRYEAFAIAAGFAIGIFLIIFFMKDENSSLPKKSVATRINYTIATWVVAFLPMVFSVLVWMYMNWMIMKDPFYFLLSDYSNSAAATATVLSEYVSGSANHVLATLSYIGVRLLPFIPLFLVITAERIATGRILKLDYWMLFSLVAVITGFHYAMLLFGKSFGWIRFFSFSMPICIAWLPYELKQLTSGMRRITVLLCAAALVLSSLITLNYFGRHDLAPEEHEALNRSGNSMTINEFDMASLINESYYDGWILLDPTYTFGIILNLDHPEHVYSNGQVNYLEAIKNPKLYGIRYVLVPDPASSRLTDIINNTYPDLYEHGADWCVERAENGYYKLFEVTG